MRDKVYNMEKAGNLVKSRDLFRFIANGKCVELFKCNNRNENFLFYCQLNSVPDLLKSEVLIGEGSKVISKVSVFFKFGMKNSRD